MGYQMKEFRVFAGPMIDRLMDASLVPCNEDRFAFYQEATHKTSLGYQVGLGIRFNKAQLAFQYVGTFSDQGLALTYHGTPLHFKQNQQVMLLSFSYKVLSGKRKEKPEEKELVVPPEITVSEE